MDARLLCFREDTMRRLLLSAACLMPLALLGGCCSHMAGMCDCDQRIVIDCPCYGHALVPIFKPTETIKELPKVNLEADK
jgi:hypothetical protein